MDIINILAIIMSPIIAVMVGQFLLNKAKKREDKMQIFKALMTSRIYGWTYESVHSLNIIEIVFADDKKVCDAWKTLHDKFANENPTDTELQKMKTAKDKLIEQMAISLGYKDRITWESIQNPYIPKGMAEQLERNNNAQNNIAEIASQFLMVLLNQQGNSTEINNIMNENNNKNKNNV